MEWNKSSLRKMPKIQEEVPKDSGWGEPLWESVKTKSGLNGPVLDKDTINFLYEESYPCSFCRGVGEKPKGSVCSVCKGKKEVALRPPVIKCVYCKGRGEERRLSNTTCTVCGGKGFVSVVPPVAICSSCRGRGVSGEGKLPCTQCKGKGVVTIRAA